MRLVSIYSKKDVKSILNGIVFYGIWIMKSAPPAT